MKRPSPSAFVHIFTLCALIAASTVAYAQTDPLPSWNDGKVKQSILSFVKDVTDKSGPKYVEPQDRIATFDQDGTLWVEHPIYTQVVFAFDRVVTLAPKHPEWKTTEPFRSVLTDDKAAMAKFTLSDFEKILFATHTGMTVEEFNTIAKDWIAKAKNPRWGRPYTELIYQPMLEVMSYLRANGFKTYIVTGGGQDFVRSYAQGTYGIPPEQIIGSALDIDYTYNKEGRGILMRPPKLLLNNNFSGKPEDIYLFTGLRPLAAFGNSTGDRQMEEWTAAGNGARLMMMVLHDDADREYAYGPAKGLPDTKVGTFTQQLYDEAQAKGWNVVSMKDDWKQVFASEQTPVTAIDILLEPDATMLQHAAANNARLLDVYPKGFALDATHRPHITMLQCFVRTADLDKVYAVEGKVLEAANVNAMKLEAFKFYYISAGLLGVAGICARPTPQLLKLQADIIAAARPYMLETGPISAFTAGHDDPAIDVAMIQYVSTFDSNASGTKFNPHVSTGTAPKVYLDKMVTEPIEPFTFSPAGAAVYQLGPYGTAAKRLKEWKFKP